MGNLSFVRFFVPLLLVVSFCFASSALATTNEALGNEVNTNGKLEKEEIAKTSSNANVDDAKFKGFFHHKPLFKKKIIPVYKPVPIVVVKPVPVVKPIYKPFPVYKPVPVFKKPFHKSFPIPKKPFFPPHKA